MSFMNSYYIPEDNTPISEGYLEADIPIDLLDGKILMSLLDFVKR